MLKKMSIAITVLIANTANAANIEEATNGKTFLDQFVISGGMIVWLLLLPLSVIMAALTFNYVMTIRRKVLLPIKIADKIAAYFTRNGFVGLADNLSKNKDLVSCAISHCVRQGAKENRKDYYRILVAESLQEQTLEILRKIDWLNIIGNVAPMIGLFGTVFGMIKAFNGIVEAGGQPRPDQLAGGISMALVTTFWGLLVAIPSLVIHGVFRNRIETIASEAAMECETVLSIIDVQRCSEKDELTIEENITA